MSRAAAWRVGVVVPAKDEAATIGACVRSIRSALAEAAAPGDAWVVVVADSCTDGTADEALRALTEGSTIGEVVVSAGANVGAARAVGTERALARLGGRTDLVWLATTDADTVVPPDWLAHHLALADAGAAAVAGMVAVDSFADHPPLVEVRHRAAYLAEPDGTHRHVHGANLGVRADAYLAVGGWAPLATAEDHDLWDRIGAAGWRRISSAACRVTTSGRARGRAPDGFAGHLRDLGLAQ